MSGIPVRRGGEGLCGRTWVTGERDVKIAIRFGSKANKGADRSDVGKQRKKKISDFCLVHQTASELSPK